MQKKTLLVPVVFFVLNCIYLSSCTAITPSPTPIIPPTITPTVTEMVKQVTGTPNPPVPTPTVGYFPEMHLTLPSGLRIDEYALQARPVGEEPVVFAPVLGSQDAVLAKHAAERQEWLPFSAYLGPALLENQKLVAKEIQSGNSQYPPLSIELSLNGKMIYSTPAGVSSPSSGMRGLWTYGKHWVLEIADLEFTPTTPQTKVGKTIRDGKLINDQIKAQDVFGFQVFKDKPFYFFKRDGHINISYDGQETLLSYIDVPHYNCCSAAAFDIQQHPKMVNFFGSKNGTWYYVEIGVFE